MAVGLFFDVHVDAAIAAQLRLRQVDVLTAQDEGVERFSDDRLLQQQANDVVRLSRTIFDFARWRSVGNDNDGRSAD